MLTLSVTRKAFAGVHPMTKEITVTYAWRSLQAPACCRNVDYPIRGLVNK